MRHLCPIEIKKILLLHGIMQYDNESLIHQMDENKNLYSIIDKQNYKISNPSIITGKQLPSNQCYDYDGLIQQHVNLSRQDVLQKSFSIKKMTNKGGESHNKMQMVMANDRSNSAVPAAGFTAPAAVNKLNGIPIILKDEGNIKQLENFIVPKPKILERIKIK